MVGLYLISTGSDHFSIDHSGMAVADKYCCEHIYRYISKLSKGSDGMRLSGAADISDEAADGIRRLVLQKDVTGFLQIVGSLMAARVIKDNDKVRGGSGVKPVFYKGPRSQ